VARYGAVARLGACESQSNGSAAFMPFGPNNGSLEQQLLHHWNSNRFIIGTAIASSLEQQSLQTSAGFVESGAGHAAGTAPSLTARL
jgi:hypothetical protein